MIDKNSKFYITATQMLNDYIAGGGNVDDLGVKDEVYKYCKKAMERGEQIPSGNLLHKPATK